MKKITDYLIGSDFELFLMHKPTGEIISADGIVKGTKHRPFSFDPSNKDFKTSLDNVLFEGCIPPTNDVNAWVAAIKKVRDYAESILPEDVCLTNLAAARLDDKWLQTDNARTMGCDTDFCVWTRSANEKPDAYSNLRSTGMHVHLGFKFDIPTLEATVKALDLFLSVPAVLIEPESERKQLYGKAGCFRVPPHGLEYRSLSGYFSSTPELSEWVFDNTKKAIDFVNDDRIEEIEAVGEQIQQAINSNHIVLAQNLVRQFDLNMI